MQITIEIEALLEALWTEELHKKDVKFVDADSPLLAIIQKAYEEDPALRYKVHIQTHNSEGVALKFPGLWRYRDWKETNDAFLKQKLESEVRVQVHNYRNTQIQLIADCISRKFAGMMPEKITFDTASKIYEEENLQLALTFGVNPEDIVWPKRVDEHVRTVIIPQLKKDGVI